jgi:D-tyrosyl-tRNA(Tyr) deacylase
MRDDTKKTPAFRPGSSHPWSGQRAQALASPSLTPSAAMRFFSPPARPDQTATTFSQLKLALLESRLTFAGAGSMIGLLQRVTEASVSVEGRTIAEIGRGLLVLVAVHRDDAKADVSRLVERVLTYRVFPDSEGRMNRSLLDENLALLVVPQFTLAADTKKGTRASFTRAAEPAKGSDYFDRFVAECDTRLNGVQAGVFGADMKVALVNDGPVTLWLET